MTATITSTTKVNSATDSARLTVRQTLSEIYEFRYLLQNLVVRDLKIRYKNSALGILWSLLSPLMLMVVFILIFSVFPNNSIENFAVFFLVGLLPWNFFRDTMMAGTQSFVVNQQLIKKVYFPRILIPLATILSNLVHFLIASVILIVFLFIYDLGISRYALWMLPLLLTECILIFGLSLFLSTWFVFHRDVLMILDVILLGGFFATPIIYSLDTAFPAEAVVLGITLNPASFLRWVNPMASIVDGMRTVLWGTGTGELGPAGMDLAFFMRTFITAVIILFIGFRYFAKNEYLFAEKL